MEVPIPKDGHVSRNSIARPSDYMVSEIDLQSQETFPEINELEEDTHYEESPAGQELYSAQEFGEMQKEFEIYVQRLNARNDQVKQEMLSQEENFDVRNPENKTD